MAKNLTRGVPAKLILGFAVPLLIGNLFQQAYGIVNTLIVGRILGVDALAAVGSTGGIMFFIIGFVQAMTSGFSIVTAQHYGARRAFEVRRSFCVSMVLCAFSAAVLTALAIFFAHDILELLQTPKEILEEAHGYIRVIYGGIAASMAFNMFSNSILALGDSRPPLFFLIIGCLINISLDLIFILGFSMGVVGAAWATVFAQISTSLLCLLYITKRLPALRVKGKHWKFSGKELLNSMRIGLPMGFQASIIAIGAIILQWALNSLGPNSVAAFTVARSIDMVAILPLASFGLAMATYVGQNYGAGDIARIKLGVKHCCIMSLSFSVFIAFVNIFAGQSLISLFTDEAHHEVISLAQIFLTINAYAYWVLALLFIFRFSLQGLGHSLAPTIAGVMELVMRAMAAVILTKYYGFVGACSANALAWIGACVPLAIAYFVVIKRLDGGELGEGKKTF